MEKDSRQEMLQENYILETYEVKKCILQSKYGRKAPSEHFIQVLNRNEGLASWNVVSFSWIGEFCKLLKNNTEKVPIL